MDTRVLRRRGLLGLDRIDVLAWFPRTRQVHTLGMRVAIDVAHVARDGRVLRLRTVRPWRLSAWLPRAVGVLEAGAGVLGHHGVAEDRVLDGLVT